MSWVRQPAAPAISQPDGSSGGDHRIPVPASEKYQ